MINLSKWTRNNPFKELFDEIFSESRFPWLNRSDDIPYLKPAVDIFEEEDSIVIKASLPGMTKEDIEIVIEAGVLHIRGEIRKDDRVTDEKYFKRERYFGCFQRSFALGDTVETDGIKASYEQGVLTLEMPKARKDSINSIKKVDIGG